MKPKLDLTPGRVELHVSDLNRERDFYTDVIGLEIQEELENSFTLGKDNISLLVLHAGKNLKSPKKTDAGLYHFAILFEKRSSLAHTLHSVLRKRPELFTGSADHLVSEAFYLNDPEGNGIELYFDRDKSLWNWEKSRIQMASNYLDPEDYLAKNITLEEPNTAIQMGHFHLKVGDITRAKQFYVDILGFDITAEYPGALFLSVGGYHHHVGLNAWESENADKRADSLGLKAIEFVVPTKTILETVEENLKENNVKFQNEPNALHVLDPWNNQIKLTINA